MTRAAPIKKWEWAGVPEDWPPHVQRQHLTRLFNSLEKKYRVNLPAALVALALGGYKAAEPIYMAALMQMVTDACTEAWKEYRERAARGEYVEPPFIDMEGCYASPLEFGSRLARRRG